MERGKFMQISLEVLSEKTKLFLSHGHKEKHPLLKFSRSEQNQTVLL